MKNHANIMKTNAIFIKNYAQLIIINQNSWKDLKNHEQSKENHQKSSKIHENDAKFI